MQCHAAFAWQASCDVTSSDQAGDSVTVFELFQGDRCFPGELYKFHLKPEHKPARHAPRKIPVHLDEAFKQEINSYVVVKDVQMDSSNSHSPNHSVKRKLRICLGPGDLNEALERKPYHSCSVDKITVKLHGMKVFTKVGFKEGYWMVKLHPDSRKLTCMALPFDRLQWTRPPIGTLVARTFSN